MISGKISAILKLLIVAILLMLQVLIIFFSVYFLRQYSAFIYTLLEFACMVTIIALINKNDDQVYRFSWAMIVAVFSVSGLLMYFMWGRYSKSKKIKSQIASIKERLGNEDLQAEDAAGRLKEHFPSYERYCTYLEREGFPVFTNTDVKYLPLGEEKFKSLFEDLEKAEKFIFLEYFIVFQGKIFERLYEILRRKAGEGVEVRFMFDDAGSIFTTSRQFVSRFKEDRIEYRIFNPLHRYVDKLYLNYRNHQKIAVIDGNIAYTGGINIGDEYANLYEKHGHWKDTAIRIEGEGAWGLTRIFLQMWEFSGKGKPAGGFGIYHPRIKATGEGFVQPFADGPSNNPRNPAETIYRQIIANARDYVYVTTPYLILDEVLIKTLVTAAQSGVDVRIVTPRVFDHWYTKYATHSYYESLLAEGVRIFEYTPGFMHAKMILSDGSNAVVGSINLDYRSLFLHYECGVWICGMPAVKEIEQDMRKTFDQSYEITLEEWKRRPWHHKVLELIMRIFAPII